MFLNKFSLSPDEAGTAAPASNSATSTPVNSSATTSIPTTASLFADMEAKMGLTNKEPDDEAFGQQIFGQPSDSENIEEFENDVAKEPAETPDEDDGKPLYIYEAKVGDNDVKLIVENKEQLDHYLKRAAVAPEIFKENKQLRTEIGQYKERASDADEFDRMAREDPLTLLDVIAEDLTDDQLTQFVQGLSSKLQQTQEQRAMDQKLRQAELIIRQNEMLTQREQRLQQQQAASIEAENVKQIQNWRASEFNKWADKIPKEHHAVLDDMIESTLLYASKQADAGIDVDLVSLTNRLSRFANSIVGTQKSINKKVGQATQAARQQATSKLQASTNQAQVSRNSGASVPQYKGTDDMFSDLIRKIGSGSVRLKS